MSGISKHRMSNITKAPKYFFFCHSCGRGTSNTVAFYQLQQCQAAGRRHRRRCRSSVPRWQQGNAGLLFGCGVSPPSLTVHSSSLPPSLSLALTHCSREVGPAPPVYDITGLEIAAALKLPVMTARCAAKPHHQRSGGVVVGGGVRGGAQGRWDWQR